jgi:hypothetical protein
MVISKREQGDGTETVLSFRELLKGFHDYLLSMLLR